MIAAIDDKRGIATDAGIPWDIPSDRRFFREQTSGAVVLMGYATYLEFEQPLPSRRNIVVDERGSGVCKGFESTTDVVTYLKIAKEDIWIIGGAGLFGQTLEHADELLLTRVTGDYNCTKFFPSFAAKFKLVWKSATQHENGYEFYFGRYTRQSTTTVLRP